MCRIAAGATPMKGLLGLSTGRDLVRALGGTGAESEVGVRSTFSVLLPVT